MAALFVKGCEAPKSKGSWLSEWWCIIIYTEGYYAAVKNNEAALCVMISKIQYIIKAETFNCVRFTTTGMKVENENTLA